MGKLSRSQRLEKSFSQIDEIFNRARILGITLSPKKKRLSDESLFTYRQGINQLLQLAYGKYGVCEIKDLTLEMVHAFIDENPNNWTAKRLIHAAAYFQEAASRTRVLSSPVSIIDKNSLLGKFRSEQRFRRVHESTVLKASTAEVLQVVDALSSIDSPFQEQSRRVLLLGLYTGSRIGGALTLHNGGITLVQTDDKHAPTVARVQLLEKGGLRRTVEVWEPEGIAYLQNLKDACPNENTRIITMRNQYTGQIQSNRAAARAIERIVRSAAHKAGVGNDERYFSPHSARKAFAQCRVDQYKQWSDHEIDLEIARRIGADISGNLPLKYDRIMNYKIFGPTYANRRRKKQILFLTALDIGHARVGVMSYYVDYD